MHAEGKAPSAGAAEKSDDLVMGRITAVYGIKGWVKVYSFTAPMTNVLNYRQWRLRYPDGRQETVQLDNGRTHGKGLIALIAKTADRNQAERFIGAEILVNSRDLPEPDDGEFYWHQLEGLTVLARDEDGNESNLGKVHHLMETGANDVLVVRGASGSIDRRERLIPWLEEQVVTEVNLEQGFIRVDWDPEF
ncbi:ribosome maturation factor RimM [Parendozoicomonas haliclonae]|uniref:Ribosome maturation factor RimM n=1 Tax=Parendozoicomonas haliclonae TaxID=1960125 RepID=A0A1X7AQL1_9GAMM|nr:ribosome maturation factor RimM [Parendozoicomonas haliclonae]SMA50422.1 Ribosome maturation factor RimM [Parendozoicomonas haliclonae]